MIGRLNHVAIAVPDLEAASAQYRDALGAKVGAPQDEPDHGVTVVFIELPNTKIELLYPLGEDSPITGFLDKNPSGGIHHICYEVEDILAARDRLKATGARVLGKRRAEDRRPWQAGAVPAPEGFQRLPRGTGAGLMGITSAIVLFAVIWFMTFLIVIPIRLQTQGDAGEVVPGTHAGSPEVHNLKRKAWITTLVSVVLWIAIASIIIFEVITVRDIDGWMFNRMPPLVE